MSKVKTNGVQEVIAVILQNIPSDAAVTKIEYEGPMIAIYTKNPRYLLENNVIISNIVKTIKKRIVVRTDESIRKSEEDARKIIMQLIPKDVGIVGTFFDTALGEVIIDVKKPWMLTQVDETKDEGMMVGVGGEGGGSGEEHGYATNEADTSKDEFNALQVHQAQLQKQLQMQALLTELVSATGWKVRIRKALIYHLRA